MKYGTMYIYVTAYTEDLPQEGTEMWNFLSLISNEVIRDTVKAKEFQPSHH